MDEIQNVVQIFRPDEITSNSHIHRKSILSSGDRPGRVSVHFLGKDPPSLYQHAKFWTVSGRCQEVRQHSRSRKHGIIMKIGEFLCVKRQCGETRHGSDVRNAEIPVAFLGGKPCRGFFLVRTVDERYPARHILLSERLYDRKDILGTAKFPQDAFHNGNSSLRIRVSRIPSVAV